MRIDIVSIFPDYLSPLGLSLPGKARDAGLVQIEVHDLREWTRDRHRTVDDTPYGGGAGMVMKPEPWGEALDQLVVPDAGTTVVFTTPSGTPFTQEVARELATGEHLVFACGRYEGIDQRVIDHAGEVAQVREISLGDYVLNGGEVAALAITEAVVRLLPGFMGNPESLAEESHEDGLLEYPVYTKPQSWRGHEVPPVLLSGNHAAIADWRRDQAMRRTAQRRPDLLHASTLVDGWEVVAARRGDAPEVLTLQLACAAREAAASADLTLAALREGLAEVEESLSSWDTYVVRSGGRLVGSVRGRLTGQEWEVSRLLVAPDLADRGLDRLLLEHAQRVAPPEARVVRLVTDRSVLGDLRRYRKDGFRLAEGGDDRGGRVVLTRVISRR